MKSFLLNKENKPLIRWGFIPSNRFFEGPIPENHYLAVAPTDNYIVVDIDVKKEKNGWEHIPMIIASELNDSYNYLTRSGGSHVFLQYTGNQILKNTSTKYGIDLRISKCEKTGNNGGYIRYYPAEHGDDIRNHIHEIKESSIEMNQWLEKLFS